MPRHLYTLFGLALVRGVGLGALMAIALTMTDSQSHTSILMAAVMGATLALTTNLRAISMAFGLPILAIVFVTTLWLQIIDVWLCSIIFTICAGLMAA